PCVLASNSDAPVPAPRSRVSKGRPVSALSKQALAPRGLTAERLLSEPALPRPRLRRSPRRTDRSRLVASQIGQVRAHDWERALMGDSLARAGPAAGSGFMSRNFVSRDLSAYFHAPHFPLRDICST